MRKPSKQKQTVVQLRRDLAEAVRLGKRMEELWHETEGALKDEGIRHRTTSRACELNLAEFLKACAQIGTLRLENARLESELFELTACWRNSQREV